MCFGLSRRRWLLLGAFWECNVLVGEFDFEFNFDFFLTDAFAAGFFFPCAVPDFVLGDSFADDFEVRDLEDICVLKNQSRKSS